MYQPYEQYINHYQPSSTIHQPYINQPVQISSFVMAHTPLDRQTPLVTWPLIFRPRHGALQHATPSNAASSVPTGWTIRHGAATLISYSISNIWWWYALVLYNKVTKSLPPRASFPWLTFRRVDVSKVGRRWTSKMDGFTLQKWPDWWVPWWLNDLPSMFHWKKTLQIQPAPSSQWPRSSARSFLEATV